MAEEWPKKRIPKYGMRTIFGHNQANYEYFQMKSAQSENGLNWPMAIDQFFSMKFLRSMQN